MSPEWGGSSGTSRGQERPQRKDPVERVELHSGWGIPTTHSVEDRKGAFLAL